MVVVVVGARRGRVKSSPILEDEAKDAQIRLAVPEPVAICRVVDPSVERSVAMMMEREKVPYESCERDGMIELTGSQPRLRISSRNVQPNFDSVSYDGTKFVPPQRPKPAAAWPTNLAMDLQWTDDACVLTSHIQVHDLVATLATSICYRISYVVLTSMYFEVILEREGNGMEETVMTPRN